jgi:5-histidylcysteine sulfoxide synthase/putative 4-mercaptohistidine N1-methyltranferase
MREAVDEVIANTPLTLPVGWKDPFWIVLMGIEHERIHLETSSVLIRQHDIGFVKPHPAWEPSRHSAAAPQNELIAIAAGTVQVGKTIDDPVYGWDNEYGRHEADVAAFAVSRYLVSNQEFRAFVDAGGYADDSVWGDEGLHWRQFAKAQHPTFWVKRDGEWKLRLMCEEVPMPWDWPVEVNYLEAKAFCNWKTRETGQPVRMPSEDEWYRLYDDAGLQDPSNDTRVAANLHLDYAASSCPVTQFRHGELYDVVGNVWQWTETPTYPFDGFAVHPIYDDFTTPTFDGRHNLMKGGSWIACGNEAVRASRYAFRRHFFQHAGFRYVVADHAPAAPAVGYESDRMLNDYSEFHYGDQYFGVPNFPKALAQIAIKAMGKPGKRAAKKALDLGCATGRATFELARHFERVTGIDFSARFIGAGVKMMDQGALRYTLVDEGELLLYKERTLAELDLEQESRKVEFYQGDACNLKEVFTGYDLVLAANLIDRLRSPAKFLQAIHQRINVGGLLMLTSPYTWLEEYTPRADWVGGFKRDGESFTTLDGLKKLLGPHFRLLEGPLEVPFVIRETRRKHQHTLSEVTIWERLP